MLDAFLYSQCFIVLNMKAQSICHLSKYFLQNMVFSPGALMKIRPWRIQ